MKNRFSFFAAKWLGVLLFLVAPGASAQVDDVPVVYIDATTPETLEPSPTVRVIPGEFTITRVGNTNHSLLLFVEFRGTATPGQDYEEISSYQVVPPGVVKLKVTVAPHDDALTEGDETVVATISTNPPINSLPNYTVHPRLNQATVVIHDNEFAGTLPVVSITGGISTLERCPPNALCAPLGFTLRRTASGLDKPLNVFLHYSGTAKPDVDYRALPIQVTFEAGHDSVNLMTVPLDDEVYEGEETLTATIVAGLDYHPDPNQREATDTIVDDDPVSLPIVSLELINRYAGETLPTQNAIFWAEFSVNRTGPATNELLVYLNMSQGTAVLGEDYRLDPVLGTSTVRMHAGVRSALVRLYPIDDSIYEGDETAIARLALPIVASPTGAYQIDPARASVEMVIRDNDPVVPGTNQPPFVAIVRPVAGEALALGAGFEIVVQTRDVDGFVRKVEFFADGRKIGEQGARLDPPLNGPAVAPQAFRFEWRFATPGPHSLSARATDDDGATGVSATVDVQVTKADNLPVVTVTAPDAFAIEPGSNAVSAVNTASFRIRRYGPTNGVLAVKYSMHGTAQNGEDYELLAGEVSIPAGQRSAVVVVRPRADNAVEGVEPVILQLEGASAFGPTPAGAVATYRIGSPGRAIAVISDGPWNHVLVGNHCTVLPEGVRHACFGAENGFNFRVEGSDDLQTWETVGFLPAADAAVHFVDDEALSTARRFYRIAPDPTVDSD